jgi:LuxR family transcriptional regulator, maltose regulon positive regulatory protein
VGTARDDSAFLGTGETDLLAAGSYASRFPALSAELIRRPKLVRRLEEGRTHPLAVIAAPAGYGKTTLLSEWAAHDKRPFGWVSVPAGETSPAELSRAIGAALTPIGAVPRGSGPGPAFVLVIDDAQLIDQEVLRDAIAALLPRVPSGSQIAIAARSEPRLGLGRLRAQRALTELGVSDLAMSPGEAAALLRAVGLDPDFATVQALIQHTEGWPAGLYLAALSLRSRADGGNADAGFTGDDQLVAQYLQDEFLDALGADERTFLARTAVLDRLCGPLCDAVLDRRRSAATLTALSASNLPLFALDAGHGHFRLHGLLREALAAELQMVEPQLVRRLHRRASDWYRESGDLDRTIEHAVAADDCRRAGALLWDNLLRYIGGGHNGKVQEWMGHFDEQRIVAGASLATAAAHSHLIAGDLDLARHLSQAATARGRGSRGTHREQSVAAGQILVDAWACRGGVRQMMSDARRAQALLPRESDWVSSCLLLQGTAALLSRESAAARSLLDEGADRAAVAAPHIAALCLDQLASLAIDEGAWDDAIDLADRANAIVERHRLASYPTSALALASLALTAAHAGSFDDAKAHVRRCGVLLSELDRFAPWFGAETRILLARAATSLGDIPEARALLASASRLARRTPDATLFPAWLDSAWDAIDDRAETALTGISSLTAAELRVLRFLPTHYSFREIALRLHVSPNTVKTQVHAVYSKLSATSRSEAVARASRAGLLTS